MARRSRGVTLVELLVASSVASVVLAGAWPWLWNAAVTTRALEGRSSAATSAAFAARMVRADLGAASAVLPPPAGYAAERSLRLQHRHDGSAAETVVVAWDPARRVLWRNASGTYLADHVVGFAVEYYAADGTPLAAEALNRALADGTVARVRVGVVVEVAGRRAWAGCSGAVMAP
jgi:prepilin-type N-terminal cleavage/methylation domain-containing protein